MAEPARWWRAPLRVSLPWLQAAEGRSAQVTVASGPVQAAARTAAGVIPWILVVLGIAVSAAAAVVLSRDLDEAVGGLGVELGAPLWFAGAVTLGARRGATVGRALSLLALALAGAALVRWPSRSTGREPRSTWPWSTAWAPSPWP